MQRIRDLLNLKAKGTLTVGEAPEVTTIKCSRCGHIDALQPGLHKCQVCGNAEFSQTR